MCVGLRLGRVVEDLEGLTHQTRGALWLLHLVDDCAPDNVSDWLLRFIRTHTDFVNRLVRRKPEVAGGTIEIAQG